MWLTEVADVRLLFRADLTQLNVSFIKDFVILVVRKKLSFKKDSFKKKYCFVE